MKNLNKKLIMATIAIATMGGAYAESDSINLTGAIAKAVSVFFEAETLDLGDMSDTSVANFNVVANTDYTVSAPTTGVLTNANNGAELNFAVSVSKEDSTMSVTPAAISATQAAGNYSANVTLTIAAV